jgi:hypothetical protein
MEKTYLIEDAAAYVGMNRRTFERLNLSHQEEYREAKDGKKRKVRVYKQSELEPTKIQREKPVYKPSLVSTTSGNQNSQVLTVSDLQDIARLLFDAIQKETQKQLVAMAGEKKKRQIDISSFKYTFLLNFAQALAYSGLSKNELKTALKNKKIHGRKTSENGIWKINRESIDEFCKSYFD